MTTRIMADWSPSRESGSLRDTDANPAHIGGIVTIGYGGFDTRVSVDRPTRFTISAADYAPLTFTVTPDMTGVDIRPASSHFPGDRRFSATFHYPDRPLGVPLNYLPQRRVAPSGLSDDPGLVTIPQNEHIVDPRVREVQRQLLGVGINVGPQGADGRFSVNTANGLQAFARWYNGLPEGPMLDPRDLKRGPTIAVDRLLTPEKQVALRRFAARASDVLTSVNYTSTVAVTPPAPLPWGTIALVATASAALLGGVIYAIRESSKKKAHP